MRRRPPVLRVAKWAGVAACALVIGIWVLSVRFVAWTAHDDVAIVTAAGCAAISVHQLSGDQSDVARVAPLFNLLANRKWTIARQLDWRKLSSYGLTWPTLHTFDYGKIFEGGCGRRRAPPPKISWTSIGVTIPYWTILAAIGLPTVLAWRRDCRPLPGHCPCGYNLTGNVSGTCPECGVEVQR